MSQIPLGIESHSLEALYARMTDKLGVSEVHSDQDLIALVEKRLPVRVIKSLVRSGLTDAESYRLIAPRRTLAHQVSKREPLSTVKSDKAVRVARITALAEETFGEHERAWRWMRKPKRRFGGRMPIEVLATEAGAHLIEEL